MPPFPFGFMSNSYAHNNNQFHQPVQQFGSQNNFRQPMLQRQSGFYPGDNKRPFTGMFPQQNQNQALMRPGFASMPQMPFQQGQQNQPQLQPQNQNSMRPGFASVPQMPLQQGQQQNHPHSAPDGVTYEPIDPELLKKLQADAAKEDEELGRNKNHLTEERVTINLLNDDFPKKIREFAQNERNGSVFYEHLSNIARGERQKKLLSELSKNCREYSGRYSDLYTKYSPDGEKVDIKESEIDKTILFDEGILWALSEETQSLHSLCDLYENAADESVAKKINILMYKKISDINYLQVLKWM